MTLPLSDFDAITPDWVEAVLRPHFTEPLPEITALTLAPIGAGNAGDTRRLSIEYAVETPLPKSLVCKFHPNDETARQAQAASGANLREAATYQVLAAHSLCRIPKPYLIANDESGFNLVLEDLSGTANMGDQIAGCTLAQAEAVIDELARLHLCFAGDNQRHIPQCMLRMVDVANHWGKALKAGAALARDRFADRLAAHDYEVIAQAAALCDGWMRHESDRLTFTHGDPRVDNIAFEQREGGECAILFDWQMAGIRMPMYDVAYFLLSSLPIELRHTHERELVRRYLDKTKNDNVMGGMEDYRFSMLASFSLTILSIASLPRAPQVDLLLITLLQRNIAAVNDWDSLSAIALAIGGDTV